MQEKKYEYCSLSVVSGGLNLFFHPIGAYKRLVYADRKSFKIIFFDPLNGQVTRIEWRRQIIQRGLRAVSISFFEPWPNRFWFFQHRD